MKLKDAFPGKYLGHENFDVPRVLTVLRVKSEDVSGGQGKREDKPVVYFREHPNGFVLNRTNFKTLVDLLGDDSDSWAEGKCELYKTTTEFKGETVPCVRIRNTNQAASELNKLANDLEDTEKQDEGWQGFTSDEDVPF